MKPNVDIIDAFEIAVVLFDHDQKVTASNRYFQSLFDAPLGTTMAELTRRFKQDQFDRDIDTAKGYRVKITAKEKKRSQFHLHIRRAQQGFIGMIQDSSAMAKSEAMLASYSLLIEQQNREIIEKNKQIEVWRRRIEAELEQAAHVQDLLVPQHIATSHITSRCQYLREMSGDFHEMVEAKDGTTTMIIGDVAGKGIYAAIMLAQTLTAFRSCHDQPTLTHIICGMVDMLAGRFPDGLFVALTLVRHSPDKQTISILNLGNPAAVLVDRSGDVELIPSVGPAIGVLPMAFYQALLAEDITLTDKRLLVFSDGMIDINLGDGYADFQDSMDVATQVLPMMDLFGVAPLDELFEKIADHDQEDDIVIAHFKP